MGDFTFTLIMLAATLSAAFCVAWVSFWFKRSGGENWGMIPALLPLPVLIGLVIDIAERWS